MIVHCFRITSFALFIFLLSFFSKSWAMEDGKEENATASVIRAKPKGEALKKEDPILYVIESHVKPGKRAKLQVTHFCGKRIEGVPNISKTTLKPISFSSGKVVTLRRSHLPTADDCPSEAIEVLLLTSTDEASCEEDAPLEGGEGSHHKLTDPLGLFKGDNWKILPGKRIKLS